ncbi:MAG: MYG1 family protein [Kiritimatiellia bacterium]
MARLERIERLKDVRRMVIHGGLAHTDDIMACAIAMSYGVRHDAVIERRDPTPAELQDPATLVLDVGGVYDPEHLDFDHHQRGRDEEPKCAYKLFAEWLGADEELTTLYPWYAAWNLVDVLGTHGTARRMGTTGEVLEGFVTHPLADLVIRQFASDPVFRAQTVVKLARSMNKTRSLWTLINERAMLMTIAGLPVADFRGCAPDEVSRCSEAWMRRRQPACMVSRDNRGPGLTVLRFNDDPRLDFARCRGRPYTLFAHPGGFVLKTRRREDDLAQILGDART